MLIVITAEGSPGGSSVAPACAAKPRGIKLPRRGESGRITCLRLSNACLLQKC